MSVWFLRFYSARGRIRTYAMLLPRAEPLGRDGEIAFGIGAVAGFELLAKTSLALRFDVVPHGLVNEPAPGAFDRHAVKDRHGFIRQDNVDALAHGTRWVLVPTLAVYTLLVWM